MANEPSHVSPDIPLEKHIASVGAEPKICLSTISFLFAEELSHAMREELDGIIAKDTFTLTDVLPGGKDTSGRWVHT